MTYGFCFLDLKFQNCHVNLKNLRKSHHCELSISVIIAWRWWWASTIIRLCFIMMYGFLFLGLEFRLTILLAWNTLRIPPLWTLNLCHKFLKMIMSFNYCKIMFYVIWFLFLAFLVENSNASLKGLSKPTILNFQFPICFWF